MAVDPAHQMELKTDKEVRRIGPTNRGLALLNPEAKTAGDIAGELAVGPTNAAGVSPRAQYAPMKAHMELASQVIAVGGTYRMAARYAGVNRRQSSQVHDRWRNSGLASKSTPAKMASGIKGRILGELGRRTRGKAIHNWEIMDLVRVLDRL
jgi:hypothetical protein